MKKISQLSLSIAIIAILSLFCSTKVKSQATAGTLTFTFTENMAGATKNVMAVWIQDNAGNFVKTSIRYWGTITNDHLPSWVSNSAQNVVDAITGPTLTATSNPTAFGIKTITWDGKNVSGTTVADGIYKIVVESSWKNPEPANGAHSTIVTYTFDKNATSTHVTPAANTNFSNITIDWVPAANSVENINENKNILIYPNPSKGQVQLDFRESILISRILVENIYGEVVYQENTKQQLFGLKNIDLQLLPNGIYFIEVFSNEKVASSKYKIILKK